MSASPWTRRIHRWVSMAFTLGVIVSIVAVASGKAPPSWVYLLALVPLAALLVSGLYLFVLPYAVRWRSGARA